MNGTASTAPPPPSTRIEAIDVVRGVVVGLIFLVHTIERYLALGVPPKGSYGHNPGILNRIVVMIEPVFLGKPFAIFSMLFGLGFYIMMSNADRKGIEYKATFVRRMLLLLVIGWANALFFRADVLTTYALLGLLLLLFYRASNKVIAITIFIMISGLPKLILFSILHGNPWLAGTGGGAATALDMEYFAAVTKGSLMDVFRVDLWDGHKWFFYAQFDIIGRAYLTFGYMLIGLWLGRTRFFEKLPTLTPQLKRALYLSLILAIPGLFATFYAVMKLFADRFVIERWAAVFVLIGMDWTNTLLAVSIFCGVLLGYKTARGKRLLAPFGPYGRMALTNYVMQSIIGSFLFYHYGLNLMAKLQHKQVGLIAVVLITLQMVGSSLWMRYFLYGPLEWLWRSGADLRWHPLLRKPPVPAIEPVSQNH